jgi:hypothetical protein
MNIWYRREGREPEIIDRTGKADASYMLREYQMAFGLLFGQPRHGKDKLWLGRKIDEPEPESVSR